ncbi:MAG: arginine--tRNA ligase domain-containing protein, partial [Candidatus Heimdallarchaeaceae archaeon]
MHQRILEKIRNEIEQIIFASYQSKVKLTWTKPPSPEFGDMSFPLFSLSKMLKKSPEEIGMEIINKFPKNMPVSKLDFQKGFLNIFFSRNEFSKNTFLAIISQKNYGSSSLKSKERVIIEHTSSNPTGPLHIGNFRGSVLGDVLARLFSFLGASVNVRYYVNDLGRQIAPLVIGYSLLKREGYKHDTKIDLWIGKIYALMNTFFEINKHKKKIQSSIKKATKPSNLYSLSKEELEHYRTALNTKGKHKAEKQELIKTLEKNFYVQESLKQKLPSLYEVLLGLLSKEIDDLESLTQEYIKKYQEGRDSQIIGLFREVTELAIAGHIFTLRMFNIRHDAFDWESTFAWSGEVQVILNTLDKKHFLKHDGKARLLKNNLIGERLNFKKKYNIDYEIPDLILVNSEGISLYPCRDIAYHLHKLDKFDATVCYNVIGKQQQLAQLSVKLALYGLGKEEIADKIIHYDYEYVSLVDRKMAGREFEYVTPDELYELTKSEVNKVLKDKDYS